MNNLLDDPAVNGIIVNSRDITDRDASPKRAAVPRNSNDTGTRPSWTVIASKPSSIRLAGSKALVACQQVLRTTSTI